MSFNRKIEELIQALRAEDESLRKTIDLLRQQLSVRPDIDPVLAKKDAHIEMLRLRIAELENMLDTVSKERDLYLSKIERLKSLGS